MEIINHPIKPEKQKAWHLHMHPYFTKQASNVVSEYIEHYSLPGDTVLDPFCGTGVTAIEALAHRRKVIAFDLNPLACFITEQSVAQIDTEKFKEEFKKLSDSVGIVIKEIEKYPDSKIEEMEIKHWYPKGIRLPKNSDKGYDFVEQLWTKKQLICLSLLWNEIKRIKNKSIREQMKLVFSATLSTINLTYMPSEKNGKKIGGGGPSILGTYRYWLPKNKRELTLWNYFNRRFHLILKAKEKWNKITEGFNVSENFLCINASISELSKHIPPKTIDYIYTDPPYGGNIAYLDLSVMWNAWLGLKINDKSREEEIIEGGDLEKSQENYEKLFAQSIEEMSKVIKKDGWLSLVFAHKKLEFWNLIVDSNEINGMEFKGSVYQPTNNSSIHYKKNISNVLCSQRVANFQKTFEKSIREEPDDLKKFILNEMERACLDQRGASIDIIYQRVLDKLLNNNTIHEAKKRGYLKLDNMLNNENLFVYEPDTCRYYVKADEDTYNQYQEEYFHNRDELKIFLSSLLKQNIAMTLDDIHKEIFEIYNEDKRFPIDKLHKDLQEILSDIAIKNVKTNNWILKSEQLSLQFGEVLSEKLVKIKGNGSSHSEIIFRLVQIGKYLKFLSWIGKREQSKDSFQGYKFSDISISEFPIPEVDKSQTDKIKQIDVIWFDKMGNPRYAFEIEESTNIMTGFERFKNLLEQNHEVSNKLFIVAPKSRQRKINDVFTNSVYIGHPLYLENKIKLIYKEELIKFYDNHIDEEFDEKDFAFVFDDI